MIATIITLIARRLVAAIPILLIVSALLFCVLRALPVDPAAMSLPPNATIAEIDAKRHEMGLDRPLPEQYAIWLRGALHGEFGQSIQFHRQAGSLVATTARDNPARSRCHGHRRYPRTWRRPDFIRVRGTILEPAADLFSIVLLSIPEFLWA